MDQLLITGKSIMELKVVKLFISGFLKIDIKFILIAEKTLDYLKILISLTQSRSILGTFLSNLR